MVGDLCVIVRDSFGSSLRQVKYHYISPPWIVKVQFLFRRSELSSIHPSPTPQKTETGTAILVFGPRATKKVGLMQEKGKSKHKTKTTKLESPITEKNRKSTRWGRMGPKSVSILEGILEPEKKHKFRLGWGGWGQNP